jgi:Ser-tRNA(Ala) deacylase AlaX
LMNGREGIIERDPVLDERPCCTTHVSQLATVQTGCNPRL